jgi:2,5-dichlorohydroquinone reductive dechlorinase
MQLSLETLVSETRHALSSEGELLFDNRKARPRFELFHAADSICSQKVRTVLAYHGLGHIAHTMDMSRGQTYLPSHVRLRMIGCETLGLSLMTTHDGSTSVTTGGCDPAVVPTLVDWQLEKVIIDSKRICIFLDDLQPDAARLRPQLLSAIIDSELAIVDNLPNYQMLNGRPPVDDLRPQSCRGKTGVDVASKKVERLDRYLTDFADDETLAKAYGAKRSKELKGGQQLFTAEAMRAAYAKAKSACESLELTLEHSSSQWTLGDSLTMADLFWAIELLRMKNLGAAYMWEGGRLPAVETFVSLVESLPSIRSAVLDWPGALY